MTPVSTASSGGVGQARLRVEDRALLTGRGRFTDDIRIAGCLHAAFVRSPEAQGRIAAVDTAEAAALPGVVRIFTGPDLSGLGRTSVNPLMPEVRPRPPEPLATGTVAAAGQPVALVVAETAAAALDAAEAVFVDIEPLPLRSPDGAAPAYRARETWRSQPAGEARNAAARATVSLRQPLLAPAALEPRGLVVDAATEPGRLTVWLGSQSPHRAREELAAVLGMEPDLVRVVAPDVGGAFGMKASLYPEDIAVAFAAQALDRCVKWTATRSEEFLASTQGRGQTVEASLSAAADGTLLHLDAAVRAPLGSWMPYSAVVPARNAGRILPGPYRVASVDIEAAGVESNSAAVGIYRGAGRPEAALAMELLIERLAGALGLTPRELRHRNFVSAGDMPWTTPTGQALDSGDYAAAYDRAKALMDTQPPADDGRLRGCATVAYIEPSGLGWESARLTLGADGTITAATGSTAQGQGRTTAVQQIVADRLGADPDAVTVVHGDSSAPETGIGALASRSTPIGGSALVAACRDLRRQAEERLGRPIGDRPDWTAIASQAGDLVADVNYSAEGEAWGYGAVGCAVAIDPETGVLTVERLVWVDDAGTVVNPMLAEGQLLGGVAQGVGEAVLERIVYDADGQLLTGSFMDYGIPRAADMPPVTLERMETPSPANLLGAKGIGEAGAIGAPAAIACAVMAALRPLGVKHLDMPYTPAHIWQAIRDARTIVGTSAGNR
ncbi:MAG: xanthine dehydrogenase family protein [Rhodospirillaceae bacterium]|nr:xanthine dehydrogenase family protein [Rhodospirillaceae bacterium]MYH38997.1 xanthine dehydrogenase family protein [Rhodospirillaceae bacterium]MYK16172.1 xanthine dehydrogenase family protein [Rhodospirillaceae bacterium]MYK60095.1 xanthine dehydrogenase family protein [Rhodospirillaceae bacterium]